MTHSLLLAQSSFRLTFDASPAATVPLQQGLDAVVRRYSGHGPLVAAFLANFLATFGDKGQLVVVTLASRYDAKRVFAGAVAAFGLWSAVEVLLGRWITRTIPGGVVTVATGVLFLCFGAWTLYSASRRFRRTDRPTAAHATTDDGLAVGLSGRVLPDSVLARVGAYGGVFATFAFILFAEFGDKTQLLTINLAATFPDAPLSVYAGVVGALALRTGIDAVVGAQAERWIPTAWVEAGAAVVFVAFGLAVLGAIGQTALLAVLGALLAAALFGVGRRLLRRA